MKRVILLIVFCLPLTLFAQSAMDYFHTAANFYVNAEKKNAKTAVQEGIRKFPDNQKLKTLASKIDQLPDPEDEQNQQNKSQQNQDQDQQQQNQNQDKNEQQQKQQSTSESKDNQDTKRKLDALQMNERKTQEKANRLENQQTRPMKQEKDW